ncbi:MAG: hypothetical protein Q9160_006686 [Pyrenula sp. 1 TL-2023]
MSLTSFPAPPPSPINPTPPPYDALSPLSPTPRSHRSHLPTLPPRPPALSPLSPRILTFRYAPPGAPPSYLALSPTPPRYSFADFARDHFSHAVRARALARARAAAARERPPSREGGNPESTWWPATAATRLLSNGGSRRHDRFVRVTELDEDADEEEYEDTDDDDDAPHIPFFNRRTSRNAPSFDYEGDDEYSESDFDINDQDVFDAESLLWLENNLLDGFGDADLEGFGGEGERGAWRGGLALREWSWLAAVGFAFWAAVLMVSWVATGLGRWWGGGVGVGR